MTGADGFVGKALCAALVRRGNTVTAAVRSKSLTLPSQINRICVGNIDRHTNWSDALFGVNIVFHLAARVHVMEDDAADSLAMYRRVNVEGTEQLARSAAASGATRLVYVSSIKVNGEETIGGRIYTEQDIPSPQDPYGISKWEAEQVLQRIGSETGMEIVILRPPLVYGPGVKGNFEQLLKFVSLGMPLPFSTVRNKRDLLYLGNLVDALIVCSAYSNAVGQIYLICDGKPISTPGLLLELAEIMDVPKRLFPFPLKLLKLVGMIIGKSSQIDRLLGSLQVDSGKIRNQLNWTPPFTSQQGLQATAEWYKSSRS